MSGQILHNPQSLQPVRPVPQLDTYITWHESCTEVMDWMSESPCELWNNGFYFSAICCCSVQQFIFTSGNCGTCMHLCLLQLCFAACFPTRIPPSLTQKNPAIGAWFMLTLLLVLAYSISPGTDRLKQALCSSEWRKMGAESLEQFSFWV